MSYCGYITKINNVRKHPNADRLKIGECFGNNVIVDLTVENETIGLYLPCDGKLGIEYAQKNNLLRKKDENGNNIGGYIDEEKRNIKALKLRGEKSDGLFMPLSSLSYFTDITKLKVGDNITILNGVLICEKYVPVRRNNSVNIKINKPKIPSRSIYPIFFEHAETEQLAYNLKAFKPGDICTITLKIHGTSGRTSNTIEKTEKGNFLINGIKRILHIPISYKTEWRYVHGSRRVVLNEEDGGYYGSNIFRFNQGRLFEDKLHKGESIFYEIAGYVNESTPIMPDCDNEKLGDKEVVKQYGKTTRFDYGCPPGESNIYVYRITLSNEDGYTVEYPYESIARRCEQLGVDVVPKFETFIYTTPEDLMERVNKYNDGADPIGKTHVREGIVVRIENREKFTAFKSKNFLFKCLSGIAAENFSSDNVEEDVLNEM